MRSRDYIEKEFLGDDMSFQEYVATFNHEPIYPSEKEKLFMEVLLDIRACVLNPIERAERAVKRSL